MKKDWHQADIIAAIKKTGTTMSAVSRHAGLSSTTLSNALTRRWPKGERLIGFFSLAGQAKVSLNSSWSGRYYAAWAP